jgi:hypothetical protein
MRLRVSIPADELKTIHRPYQPSGSANKKKGESIEARVPCGRRSAGPAVAIAVAIGQFPQRIQGPT